MIRPAIWAPPIVWMLLILGLGSDAGSATRTGALLEPLLRWILPAVTPAQITALHGLVRAAAHFAVYAILAGLWGWAFTRGTSLGAGRRTVLTLAISLGWAIVDETLQGVTTTRTSSTGDVLLDASGALGGVLAWSLVKGAMGARGTVDARGAIDVAMRLALLVAAFGGAGALLVNALLGVDSGILWATVPLAAGWLLLRLRRRPT